MGASVASGIRAAPGRQEAPYYRSQRGPLTSLHIVPH